MLVAGIVLCCMVSYTLGSIPSAIWVGKKFFNVDVREHGSKNAGATNTFRVLGKKAGIPVLLMDMLKGVLAVQLVHLLSLNSESTELTVTLQIVFGACAVLGHLFPVFANFKGGKGVATLAGVIAAIYPLAWFISLLIFLVVLLLSRYVSLSSIIAAFSFPILIIFVLQTQVLVLNVFSVVIALLILYTHRSNIKRLLNKEETKVKFKAKS